MRALLLIDVQNDFMPGGALPVAGGREILPVIDKLLEQPFDLVVATQDYHPADHKSFASQHGKSVGQTVEIKGLKQMLWPEHCVAGSYGASLASGWKSHKVQHTIHKGTEADIDSYSAFFDNGHLKATELEQLLQAHNIKTLIIAGLATDYCVKYSALDARSLGFDVYVVVDACRAVNIQLGDEQKSLEEMQKAGAHLITSHELLA